MDIAIVTGAETPLGLRLIERLIRLGCRVHGIGNNFSKVTFADHNFIAHAIDVSDLEAVTRTTSEILEKEQALHILIHAIDVTPGAPFEKLPVGNLEAILKIGLLGPVMLTRLALPNLLRFRGQLINIIPANKSGHPASAANALIEGGLREMNTALFDQARDGGLRVTNLILRQNLSIDEEASPEKLAQTRIDPEHVARTVESLLNENSPNVPNEITLYPRLSRDAPSPLPELALPIDPYAAVVLPPKEYCPPAEPKIPTKAKDRIERTIPYTDEEMEDKIAAAIEDFESHPERYEQERRPRKQEKSRNQQSRTQEPRDQEPRTQEARTQEEHPSEAGSSKRRRGRRRGGRNRNREREGDESPRPESRDNLEPRTPAPQREPSDQAETQRDRAEKPARNRRRDSGRKPDDNAQRASETPKPHTAESPAAEPKPQADSQRDRAEKPARNRRRDSGRKPDDNAQRTSETPKPLTATAEPKPEHQPTAQEAPKPAASAENKPVKKKAATKKAAKKAAKKVPAKKAAKKKAAKKKAAKKVPAKKAAKKAAKKTVQPAE